MDTTTKGSAQPRPFQTAIELAMAHEFVNHKGEPVDLARQYAAVALQPPPRKPKTKRVASADEATGHLGFEVLACRAQTPEEAKRRRAPKVHKPLRRRFEVEAAAREAAAILARDAQWQRVWVEAVLVLQKVAP